jgi:hypothetical protein
MRSEYKYIIEKSKYLELKDYFEFIFDSDKYNQLNGYPVSTIYYDTPTLDFYYDKVNGERMHKKARLRTYGENIFSGPTFFEVKHKDNEDQIKKRKMITKKMPLELIPGMVKSDDHEFSRLIPEMNLIPTCDVRYQREAFFWEENGIKARINFDSKISITEVGQKHLFENIVFPECHVVMEVKLPNRMCPSVLKTILAMSGAQRTTFSKYASGMNIISRNFGMELPNEF